MFRRSRPRRSRPRGVYAKIAPSAPHALHMPSHTFTRLGYWQDSIDTNIASASRRQRREGATAEELHAMDYQAYAYLQLAQDRRGARGWSTLCPRSRPASIPTSWVRPLPGRQACSRWRPFPRATRSSVRPGARRPRSRCSPSRFPQADAMTWFARGLGAARSGNPAAARAAIDALQQLEAALAKAGRDLLDRTGRDPAAGRDWRGRR